VMSGYVDRGEIPGLVALVSRRGETHVHVVGVQTLGEKRPMRRDSIFRIASMTKPLTAAAAMILVEECKLRLDEPVDRLLPELANRRVLKRIDGPLDDTTPAMRPISVRDLLTLRLGLGHLMQSARDWPIQQAVDEQQLLTGPPRPQSAPAPDEWIRRVAALPLMHQPGERWLYDLGLDVLGVLIARASGKTFGTFLRERLFEPLGMKDTGFSVPAENLDRFTSSYTGALELYDGVEDSEWRRPPRFESGAGGLVSTADDYLAFCRMMLDNGRHGSTRILSRPSIEVMTTDQVTPGQRKGMEMFFGANSSWGFGMSVITKRDDLAAVPGRFGWSGGLGTTAYADPRENLVGILMTQRMMDSPEPPRAYLDFWTLAYQAIDD
jgi:CubicO group peptidase (beta-lactamase class C family)